MRRLTGTVLSARIEETANTVNRIMVILSHQLRTVLPTRHEGHPFRLTILSHFMGPRRFHRSCIERQNNGAGVRSHMTATAGPTVAPPGATIFQAGDVQGAPFAPVGPYER